MSETGIGNRARFREAMVAQQPRWYTPTRHLIVTTGSCLVAAAFSAYRLHGVTFGQLLAIPAALLFSNVFEWWTHKYLLHRQYPLFRPLYAKHTLLHHRAFHEQDMPMRDWREASMVLLPAIGVAGLVLAMVLVAGPLAWLLSPNASWLLTLTISLYILGYELLHLFHHLPDEHPCRRLPGAAWVTRHHARHHDPRLMGKWNFNVTLPLADLVFRTFYRRRKRT